MVAEHRRAWNGIVGGSPKDYLQRTFDLVVGSANLGTAERLAQAAYTELSKPVDKIQASYYRLMDWEGEGHASTQKAKRLYSSTLR